MVGKNARWAMLAALGALTACAGREKQPVTTAQALPPPVIETAWSASNEAVGGGPAGGAAIGAATPPTRDTLDESFVQMRVDEQLAGLREACYSSDLGMSSMLIQMRIAPSGRVEDAKRLQVNGPPDVAECVRRNLARMSFPASARGATIPVTLLFQ